MKCNLLALVGLLWTSVCLVEPSSNLSDVGPNLSTVGRSLFDQIVAKWQAEGKHQGQLPYPFEDLVSALGNEDNSSLATGVLIPRGRSLQKDAARPNYFSFPRVVVAFGSKDHGSREIPVLKLQNRLFIGYVEPAEQLEVIS